MVWIKVTPEQLFSVSQQVGTAVEQLNISVRTLQNLLAGLDFESSQRAMLEGEINRACQTARSLAIQTEQLSVSLTRTAEAFSTADQQGASTFISLTSPLQNSLIILLPNSGGGFILAAGIFSIAVPVGSVLFTLSPNIFGQVPVWVRDFIGKFFPSKIIPDNENLSQETGTLKPYLDVPTMQETQIPNPANPVRPQEATPITIPNEIVPSHISSGQWWVDVPNKSQAGLQYQGVKTAYGCVPTSASMILDYWHEKNPDFQTTTPQELINENTAQKEFDHNGMAINQLGNDLDKLGYQTDTYTNSDLATLKEAVAKGPVIAGVRVGMSDSGYPHAVVVTGISDDNHVRINDPLTGNSKTYTWGEFLKSWGSNFGKSAGGTPYPTCNFITIQPN